MPTRLTEVQINEVSFVDNPADPRARVEFFKRDDTEVEKRANVGEFMESRIHRDFTNMADDMFGDGRLTQKERISLSSGIGRALKAFRGHIEGEESQLFDRRPFEEVNKGQPGRQQVSRGGKVRRKKVRGVRPFRVNDEEDDIDKASRFFSAGRRQNLASEGKAMSDGSFPIPDKDALRRAMQSIGRTDASKRAAVRAHIRRRAKALGAMDMLSESFAKEEDMEKGFIHRLAARMGFEVDDDATLEDIDNAFIESATMDVDQVIEEVGKAIYPNDDMEKENGGKMDELDLSSVPEEVAAHIEKLEEDKKKLEADLELAKADDEGDTDEEETEEDILKSADPKVIELLEKAQADATEAQKIAKTERDARLEREFLEKAAGLPHVGGERKDVASLMKEFSEKVDSDTFAKLEEIFRAANEQIAEGELFKVAGMSGAGTTGDAYGQLEGIAKGLQENDNDLTPESAFALAMDKNPELYARYQEEQEA